MYTCMEVDQIQIDAKSPFFEFIFRVLLSLSHHLT